MYAGDEVELTVEKPVAGGRMLARHEGRIVFVYGAIPGERVRAALICLFQRSPAVELLVLDEPTFSLDLVGQRALTRALRAWPGGLVVASHDRAFLSEISVDRVIELGKPPRLRPAPLCEG